MKDKNFEEVNMLHEMKSKDIKEILEYLRNDIQNCIYLYIDIWKYGVSNPNMKTWFQKDDQGFNLIIMKYHNSFQVYSHLEHPDVNIVYKLMKENNINMVSAKKELIDLLSGLAVEDYHLTLGEIIKLTNFHSFQCEDVYIEEASEKDAYEIAELICSDEYYKDSYTVSEFHKQLLDRMSTKMGRSFIIRDSGKIVAHNSIAAETDDIAVAAMLLVKKEYRNTVYGLALEEFIVKKLNSEGKLLFGFSTNKKRRKQFEMMGNEVVAKYGKLIKK